MSDTRLPLRTLVMLAQRDVQRVLEYLASPEARRVAPETPSAVIATVGRLKLSIPVVYDLVGPVPQRDNERKEAELLVATPVTCRPGDPYGTVEVEFITCPKKYA